MTPLETWKQTLPSKSVDELDRLRLALHRETLGGGPRGPVEDGVVLDFTKAIREEIAKR